jgi:hypothetical protein
MAPDDRERTFEEALARHLRPDAPREVNASHPDAEILAAYHERLLAPDQMISWKGHIAGCTRCQEILTHLEATDELLADVSLEAREDEHVLTRPEPEVPELAHVAAPAPMPAAPQTIAAARWSRRLKALPGANWRWLAPAGVLAAGLLLWVSFHETTPPKFQLAKNTQPAAPSAAPAALPPPAVSANANKEAASSAAASPSVDLRAGARGGSYAPAQNEPALREQEKSAPVHSEMQADKLTGVPRVAASPKERTRADGDARLPSGAVGGVATAERELQKQVPRSAAAPVLPPEIEDQPKSLNVLREQAESQSMPKAKSVASGRQTPQKEEQTTDTAAPAPQQTTVDATALPVGEDSAKRIADIRNMRLTTATIPAPGGTVMWQVAPAGIIQRSIDAGTTYTFQASGVVADLLSGSAPSDKICWIVGRSGTILRTTDGGKRWRKIRAPVVDDLAAVFAVDAQQATVTSANKTYKTTDAGHTWTLLPSP